MSEKCDGDELSVIKHHPIVEHTRQRRGLLQRVHMAKAGRDAPVFTVLPQLLPPLSVVYFMNHHSIRFPTGHVNERCN